MYGSNKWVNHMLHGYNTDVVLGAEGRAPKEAQERLHSPGKQAIVACDDRFSASGSKRSRRQSFHRVLARPARVIDKGKALLTPSDP